MQTQAFSATVRHQPGITIVDLYGGVDRDSESTLSSAYTGMMAANVNYMLLNFEMAGYINSTGIAVVVGLLARARKDGKTLVVSGLSEHYRTIFEITRLIDFVHIYPDEASAVAALQDAEKI